VSFRNRLTMFFVLIVLVPMVAVTVVLFRLISDSENGKNDARMATRVTAAISLYRDASARAAPLLRRLGADRRLGAALSDEESGRAARRARQLLGREGARRIAVVADDGRVLFDVGNRDAAAPARRDLIDPAGRSLGRLEVSVEGAPTYARLVRRTAGAEVVVRRDERVLASTLPSAARRELPRVGTVDVAGREYRVASFDGAGFRGSTVRVSLLGTKGSTTSAITRSRVLASAILLGFFALAFAFAVAVSRSLSLQIGSFLDAARRLGGGDFSTTVPTSGRDEFSALGQEFNKMSGQLERRLAELQQERSRLESSLRRIGETFASNLDRHALLEIVVRTAVEALGADAGRVRTRSGDARAMVERVAIGDTQRLESALDGVETKVLELGVHAEGTTDGASALAYPLRSTEGDHPVHGLVSIARTGTPFTESERELFRYLAGQAAISIENVGLHETVQLQARTDELTGLANHRRFREFLTSELERSRRFGHDVGLALVDLDDFKRINDTYGHQQGDLVLREVANALRESSREIDEPARYGGEELALVLPETDLDGAYNLAERVRERIAEMDVPLLDESGTLKVTASVGVAAMGGASADREELIRAADAALYEAKRSGKNRTVRAQ
jgi:diguanylate cyclase (GGDEF)-like protein